MKISSLIPAGMVAALMGCEKIAEPELSDVQRCFAIHKSELLDPESAYIVDDQSYATDDKIKVVYRAKNAYGGYIPGDTVCELDDEGKITGLKAALYRLDKSEREAKRLLGKN